MKIRSITYFVNPRWPSLEEAMRKAGGFLAAARPAFQSAGFEVQTARLATVPFPQLRANWVPSEAVSVARDVERAAKSQGFDYISLGPAVPAAPGSFEVVPEILAATDSVFLSGRLAAGGEGIALPAVRACAEIIHQIATLSPDGFANLRFAALANVPAGAPFFPAAYHDDDDKPAFALATEAADLAVEAVGEAASLAEARQGLVAALETQGRALAGVGESLEQQLGVPFGGIDFSLAPFPEAARSLGTAMERLGNPALGLHGSLAAAAFLADAIDRSQFRRTGFSGLMLPVLEDAVLAARAAEGTLTVNDLLLYSAVCGTGLDTLPLPGDTSVGQLQAILLDLAALAQRLDKPLTARLMPVPGKSAGDPTGFDFAYFANSRVLAVKAEPLQGLFAGNETFQLKRRGAHQ
jgi:uncharacterized protein (UPF0210 family)